MTIFINFLHCDKAFADKLVILVSQRNLDCCIEHCEFSEGESLIKKIEAADDGTSAILVVLSKESAASAWCKEGLSAGLMRELDDKRAVIIPVLLEDCEIPGFAQGRQIADFHKDVDAGMHSIVEKVSKVGILAPTDGVMSLDWLNVDGKLVVLLCYNDLFPSFACVTYIEIRANSIASEMYKKGDKIRDVNARLRVFEALHSHFATMPDAKPLVTSQVEYNLRVAVHGFASGEQYSVLVNVRLLGDVPECEIPVDVPCLIFTMYTSMCAAFGKQPIKLARRENK